MQQETRMEWFFGLFRDEGFPTQFPESKTAADTDVLEAGLILAFLIVFCCFLLVAPGLRRKTRWSTLSWVTGSLFIGSVILCNNFGQDWEVASIENTRTPYKAGQPHEINATIGLRIGLRSVNITLKAIKNDSELDTSLHGEIINYNEQFHWTWDQGRLGFGPFAGRFQREFRKGQLEGLPLPILWVADYFTIDGEGLRFGRFYRIAGWYTHITMWTAFPSWILANYFFTTVIHYGAIFTILTGLLQVLACILWAAIQNPFDLVIPFEGGELKTVYGINYWMTLASGLLCILLGIVVIYMNIKHEYGTATFFGVDPLSDYDEHFVTPDEVEYRERSNSEAKAGSSRENDNDRQTQVIFKRRSTNAAHMRWNKTRARKERNEEQEYESESLYSHA